MARARSSAGRRARTASKATKAPPKASRAARGRAASPQAAWAGLGPAGYAGLLGLGRVDSADLGRRILEGFPYGALARLQERLEVTAEELGRIVLIAPRTLARRKSEGRLLAEESDRLLRAARILGRAIDLFEGDEAAARRWLKTKNRALGDHEPLEVARTDVGAREVETLIGRLEHGVVS